MVAGAVVKQRTTAEKAKASAGRDAWEDEDGERKWAGDTGSEDELEGEARLRVSLGFLRGEYSEQPDWEEAGWFDPVHSSYT